MTDVSAELTPVQIENTERPTNGRSALSWVFLALWTGWLVFMVVVSWREIGRPRLNHEFGPSSSPVRYDERR